VAYAPRTMLSIVLLAWAQGIRSTREIADRCETDIRFMYVAEGAEPDYRSIARFLRRIAPAMEELQRQFVEACSEMGFLHLRRIALDGTKLRSAASQWKRWLKDADEEDLEEAGFEVPGTSDPEARAMRDSGGYVLGYNAQAAVDCDTGLVVASDVVDSRSDRGELSGMADGIASRCGEAARGAELVADSGYDSHEGLQKCADLGLEAVVPPQDSSALFWTPVSEDEVVCPMGKSPTSTRQTGPGDAAGVSHHVRGCTSCRFFGYCCKTPEGRSLQAPAGCNPVLRVLQAHLARSPGGKEAMRERMATVEPFFGFVKWNRGMNRLHLRGLAGARLEFGLITLSRNVTILGRCLAALLRGVFRRIAALFADRRLVPVAA